MALGLVRDNAEEVSMIEAGETPLQVRVVADCFWATGRGIIRNFK